MDSLYDTADKEVTFDDHGIEEVDQDSPSLSSFASVDGDKTKPMFDTNPLAPVTPNVTMKKTYVWGTTVVVADVHSKFKGFLVTFHKDKNDEPYYMQTLEEVGSSTLVY